MGGRAIRINVVNVLNTIEYTTIPVQVSGYIEKSGDEDIGIADRILNWRGHEPSNVLKSIFELLDFDIVHTHHTFSSVVVTGLYVVSRILRRRTRFVHTVHRNFNSFGMLKRLIYTFVIFPFRDALIFNSESTCNSLSRITRKVFRKRLEIIYNGIDCSEIPQKSDHWSARGARLINIARMVPIKNQITILRAVKILRDKGLEVSVELCGDGPLYDDLNRFVHENGIRDIVMFHGLIAREEVYKRLLDADIAITASLNEGFGVATVEAMFANVLVLATDIPVHREIIGDRDLLFTCGHAEELAERIDYYINNQNEALEKMAKGRKTAQRFDLRQTAKQHCRLYKDLAVSVCRNRASSENNAGKIHSEI